MKVWNRRKEKLAARVLAFLLIIAVVVQSVQGTGAAAAANAAETEKTKKTDVLEKYGIIAAERNVNLYCNMADLDTDIYTGKDFVCSGTKVMVGGEVDAQGTVYPWCARFQASKINQGYEKISMPELRSRIESQSDHWEEQNFYMNVNEKEVCNGFKKSASGIQISGTEFRGDCYLMAEESIQYSVNSLNKNGGRIVLYSEKGDICISGSDIVINGILAAPNGNVRINANQVTINGRIYANGVEMSGTYFNMNTSDKDMELLGEKPGEKEIIKIYNTDEDFGEGTASGISIRDDKLSLSEKTAEGQKLVRAYNQEAEDGVSAEVTLDTDRISGENGTVNYQITFDGKSSMENQLPGEVDASFATYKGNLYAFINKKMLWPEAKEFCEKNGGHLITMLSKEENDVATQLVKKYGCNYTAIGFTDQGDEGNWRWVTGEPVDYINWNPGEPNNSFGRGQDFGYMYSSGRWDDGYNDNRAPFLCEWEGRESLVPEEGREIRLVVVAEGSVEAGEGWNCTDNGDGTTTAVYEADTIGEIRSCPLSLAITPEQGEGYQSVVRDSYYTYYDVYGDGHRVSMGDLWLPADRVADEGTWCAVYDSGTEGTKWGNVCWEACQAGDSEIKAHVKAYDSDRKEISEADVINGEALEKIQGRFIEIQMTLERSRDFRSPSVEWVMVANDKANPYIVQDKAPESELICHPVFTQNSWMTAYCKVSGGSGTCSSKTEWSLWKDGEELGEEEWQFKETAPFVISFSIGKPGRYELQAMTQYGNQQIMSRKEIEVRPLSRINPVKPLVEAEEINMLIDLPEYARPGEAITGQVLFPNGEKIKSIVIYDGEKELGCSGDKNVRIECPDEEKELTLTVEAEMENGRVATRENKIILDGTPPAVRIIPEKEIYHPGEKGVFHLEITEDGVVGEVTVRYDGRELFYWHDSKTEIAPLEKGTHILSVTVTDGAGNEGSDEYRFTVSLKETPTPTPKPTQKPTPVPTLKPTEKPTEAPTPVPTLKPTETPTEAPTPKPTLKPTEKPTEAPTPVPTLKPTKAPTPTQKPTPEPTETPVITPAPTEKPTATPSVTRKPGTPPVAAFESPEGEAVLTEPVDITGSAYDAEEMDYYTLEYCLEGADDYIQFERSEEPVKSGVLGHLDTTMLPNGKYEIRLSVVDKEGNRNRIIRKYVVEGGLKVGLMNLGFTDIAASMGGTKVNVNRNYSSANKNRGDFGIGWSLGVQGMTLSEANPLHTGYKLSVTGSMFAPGYSLNETKSHDIVVAYGDGTSDRFALTLTPNRQSLVPIEEVELGYRCVTNPKVKLEIDGENRAMVQDTELLFGSVSMYDDVSYKLTTEEGAKIYLSQKKGVYQIEDSNGNVITVDKNGYHSKDGKSIVLKRDSEDRVISATDPAGNVTTYRYDSAGDLVSVTDSADRTVSFTYDKKHNLMSITDPMGIAVARNEYDDDGRLVATIDADGNRLEYDYDIEGRTQSVKDRRGNTTVYTYDDNGNVLQTIDAYGNKTTNTYDQSNNRLSTTDALGNTTSYAYDKSGNVTSVTAADGTTVNSTYTQENLVSSIQMMDKTVMAMKYDDRGRITSIEDANGNATQYSYTSDGKLNGLTDAIGTYQKITYDSEGNVASTTNGAGESASYTYDKDGKVTSVTISREEDGKTLTFTSHYSYNAAGDITESIDNAGNVTKYEYDDNGNQTASIDAKGRRIAYAYDDLGNMTKTTYPDGTFESFTYDANGNNITATDQSGLTVTMKYDKLDRMTEKVYADGTKETYVYDAVGNVTEQTSASGAKTTYVYDERNRNTSITDALGNVTAFEYDSLARLTKQVDAKGNQIAYSYDDNGNITKTTYADGNSVTSKYDARNRVTEQKDQNGNVTKYTYDGADRLTAVTDAYGNSYTYGYDDNGNLVTVTDAEEHVTRYAHDALGRVAKVTNALGRTMEYSYDGRGNLTQSKDYAGTITKYSYDGMDRMVKKTVGTDETEYSYDKKGLLLAVTDKSGTVKYSYDKYDRLVKQTDVNGITLSYSYDKAGRLESFDNGFGKTSYEYDLLDRVTRVVDRNGRATIYEYDELGNRSAVRYPNGTTMTYTYDACQRLKEEWVTDANGATLAKYSYGLGKAGERLSITEASGASKTEITYQYDKLNRLVKEVIAKNDSELTNEYSYDKVSNRISKETKVKGELSDLADIDSGEVQVKEGHTTYTYNALNQLVTEQTPDGSITYTYDGNGNLVKQSGSKTVNYSYDRENHLLRATIQQGNSVTIESYTYDYAGNRLSKTVNESSTTYYVNDTSGSLTQVVAETDKDGKETASYTRGDELLSIEKGGRIRYYIYDGHGSTRLLTDGEGHITDRYAYDACGNLLEKEGDTENEFLYTGEQYNANTGLYYLRARYMDPSTGTFISMDSYQGSLYDPVSLHKYLYANANPVTYTDPSGYSALGLAVRIDMESTLRTSQIIYDSTIFNIGMNLLNKLWCIRAVEAVSYLAAEVLFTLVIDDALNERRPTDACDVAVEILQYALENIKVICDEASIAYETIAEQIKVAIYEAKSKAEKKEKKGKSKSSGKNQCGNDKVTGQSQMQKKVEKGQAPKEVDRVDKPHVEGQQPHIHFKDGTSLNQDGSVHDAHKGIPELTNKVRMWLENNGWKGND